MRNPTPTPTVPGEPTGLLTATPASEVAATPAGASVATPGAHPSAAAGPGFGLHNDAPLVTLTATPAPQEGGAWPDWRVLLLATLSLALAFTLLSLGYDRLKREAG